MPKKLPQAQNKINRNLAIDNTAAIEQGKAYLEQGKYVWAKKELKKVIKLDPRSEPAHFELGKTYLRENKTTEAEKEFKTVLSLNANNSSARLLLAKIYNTKKDYEAALEELIKAEGSKLEEPEVYSELAFVYSMLGNYDLAVAGYKEAIRLNCSNKHIHLDLARIYQKQEEYSFAQEELKQAQRLGVNAADVHSDLAFVYGKLEDYDLAVREYKAAISLNLNNKHLHLELARIYIKQDEYACALEELKEAQRLGTNEAEVHTELAFVYGKLGDYNSEVREYKKAVGMGLKRENVFIDLAKAYFNIGKYSLAEKLLNKIAKVNPTSDVYIELLKVYKKLKKIDLELETSIKFLELESINNAKYNKELVNKFRALCGKEAESAKLKIKIIRVPLFEKMPENELDHSLLLPLGMGQIASYLRSNGIELEQDDLHVKINHDNSFGNDKSKIDRDVFFDEKRMLAYSGCKTDSYLDSVMEKVESKTRLKGYDVVLLSAPEKYSNSTGCMFLLAFAAYIKKKYKSFIIAGGPDNAVDFIIKLNSNKIDFIVKGKGESALFKLLTALQYKIGVAKIPDIAKAGNKVIIDKHSPFGVKPDFDGLDMSLYSYKNNKMPAGFTKELIDIYRDFSKSQTLVSPFRIMEGCFYECIFCGSSESKHLLFVSPKKAVENLKSLKDKYGISNYFFLNSAINISKKYINDLCDEIISSKLNILWTDCARADNLDITLLNKMKQAGCVRLIYGMETASPRLLKYIDKKISLKRLEEVLCLTDKAGILTGLEIICGFPSETKEDIQMTVDFINKNKKYINTVYYNALYLHKSAKLFMYPEKYGIENIVKVKECKDRSNQPLPGIERGFDEIGGLKWKERFDQTIEGLAYVLKQTKSADFAFPFYEAEHFMFYLFSRCKNKSDIVEIFDKARKAYYSYQKDPVKVS